MLPAERRMRPLWTVLGGRHEHAKAVAAGVGVAFASPATGRVATAAPDSQFRLHCWLPPLLQDHSCTSAPLAVDAPDTSRHRPDCTPVIVPLALTFHCWFAWPLHA